MRPCRICGEMKAEDEFYMRNKATGKRRNECDPCYRAVQNARYHANPEARKAKIREYQLANPDKVKAWRPAARAKAPARARLYKYGVTRERWAAMLIEQLGRCAICNKQMTRPCIDHDHATGAIRGLLCVSCNGALGHLNDDPRLFEVAAAYLRAHALA